MAKIKKNTKKKVRTALNIILIIVMLAGILVPMILVLTNL
jgi:hypothetical protein